MVLQGFCKTLYQAFCHMATDCIHCPVNLIMKALHNEIHRTMNTVCCPQNPQVLGREPVYIKTLGQYSTHGGQYSIGSILVARTCAWVIFGRPGIQV